MGATAFTIVLLISTVVSPYPVDPPRSEYDTELSAIITQWLGGVNSDYQYQTPIDKLPIILADIHKDPENNNLSKRGNRNSGFCRQICSTCKSRLSMRFAALCHPECERGVGGSYMACLLLS